MTHNELTISLISTTITGLAIGAGVGALGTSARLAEERRKTETYSEEMVEVTILEIRLVSPKNESWTLVQTPDRQRCSVVSYRGHHIGDKFLCPASKLGGYVSPKKDPQYEELIKLD